MLFIKNTFVERCFVAKGLKRKKRKTDKMTLCKDWNDLTKGNKREGKKN